MEVVPWAATVLVVVISQISASRRRWSSVVTLGYLAYASFEVVRVIPFFAIATAFFSAKPLEALSARWRWMRWEPKAPSDTAAALALAPTLLLSAMLLTNAAPRARCISISGAWVPDPLIGAALQSARPAGTLVTSFGWGQYGIWHLGPQLRVSLDGRRETVYSDERMERLWEIEAGERKSLPLLASLRPDYVWLPTREETDGVRSWLVDHGYRLDLSTGKSWLVSRQELPPVQPSPAPASSCFPG